MEQYYRIHVTPIWDEKGNLAHLVETARTITEVVEQTRETATRERRFRQFVEHALDMISMKDMEGRYMVVNHAAAAFIGMNPMDCIGRTDEEIAPPELARAIVANDREILEGRHYKRQLEKVRRRGVAVHLDTIRFPLWNYKGEVTGVCSISRDVTDQKKLEQEVLKSEKMAAIGQLATSVAHEINNPLTGVLTFAEELRADALEADPQSPAIADFDVIIREAKRCRTIVSNLLDFARLKNHNLRREDLNHIIERCLVLLKRQAEYDGVVFDLKLWPKMPEIRCDSDQIQQVVMNLVINATDAMGGRGQGGRGNQAFRKRQVRGDGGHRSGAGGAGRNQENHFRAVFFHQKGKGHRSGPQRGADHHPAAPGQHCGGLRARRQGSQVHSAASPGLAAGGRADARPHGIRGPVELSRGLVFFGLVRRGKAKRRHPGPP